MEFLDRLRLLGLGGTPWTGEARSQFWESVARLAVAYFPEKGQYMDWVFRHYEMDENRFAASVCWDIIKLKTAQVEGTKDA